jgi:hypothetical protein
MVLSEGNMSLKNPVTPPGIDPVTVRLVAQRLNHCTTPGPYILKGQNIIGYVKKRRLNWLGHVERMAEDNIVQKIKRWKPMAKRPIGRPKTRWEDDVLGDVRSMNVRNWNKVAQNRDRWKEVAEQAGTLYWL